MIYSVVKCRARIVAALLVSCGVTRAGCTQTLTWAESKQRDGQRIVEVENERIRVAVLPDLGGRVLRYVDKATGRNHLWETAQWDSAGIWDKEGNWPTFNLSSHPFHYDVKQVGNSIQ